MNTPHIIRSKFNDMDMIGYITGEFWQAGSASGPLAPSFKDMGTVTNGAALKLPYNYETDEYATRTGGWLVRVVRINQKSVTVKSIITGYTHRVQI